MKSRNLTPLRPTRLVIVLLSVFALVALVGCKAEINVSVSEEGEGDIELILAVSDAVLSLVQLGGDDPFGDLLDMPSDELQAEGLEGASVQPFSESGYSGIRIRADFDPYDPIFTDLSEDRSVLGNLTEAVGIGEFKFTRTENDDGWQVELNQETDASITDGLDDLVGDIPFNADGLNLPFILSLELPGEYVEHNADREVDGTLIWDANLLEGIKVHAISRDPGLQIEIVPIIITTVFAIIGIGIVVSVVVSRERRRRRAEEDAAIEAQSEQQTGADSSM